MSHPEKPAPKIQKLPPDVVLQIAAGEVVERPASVVKELIENAMDAAANRIEIRVHNGGRDAISVTDDGCGMTEDEALLAIEPHATSKISSLKDLSHVATFGFRGEALAAIASVSKLNLMTRPESSDHGTSIQLEGSSIKNVSPVGMPPGTVVSVEDLFFNTPARRKFMRAKFTEFGFIETMVRKAALSEPTKSFVLEHDGEIILHYPATTGLERRIAQIYGKEIFDHLIEVSNHEMGIHIFGVISNSMVSFSRASDIHYFVNGRAIKDRMIQAAIMEGYRSAIMEKRYPLAVLCLEIQSELVDVNVHPTKAEVRFQNPQPIYRSIRNGIQASLREFASTGWVAPSSESQIPMAAVKAPIPTMAQEARVTYRGEAENFSFLYPTHHTPSDTFPFQEQDGLLSSTQVHKILRQTEESAKRTFSQLEYLGNVDHTYLVLKDHEGLILIDQHAAHERVRFEELQRNMENGKVKRQALLVPMVIEVSHAREKLVEENQSHFEEIGFCLEAFGNRTFLIKEVPIVFQNSDPRPFIQDLLEDLEQGEDQKSFRDRMDHLLSTMACHSAVRAHDRLTREEVTSLLRAMDQTDLSTHCPHGRPAFIKLNLSQLETLFRRK